MTILVVISDLTDNLKCISNGLTKSNKSVLAGWHSSRRKYVTWKLTLVYNCLRERANEGKIVALKWEKRRKFLKTKMSTVERTSAIESSVINQVERNLSPTNHDIHSRERKKKNTHCSSWCSCRRLCTEKKRKENWIFELNRNEFLPDCGLSSVSSSLEENTSLRRGVRLKKRFIKEFSSIFDLYFAMFNLP